VKGISLFVVPGPPVNADGSLGRRNDVHCFSIEHKLGIKASPTAVPQFGDQGGAVDHLVGEQNQGLETRVIIVNEAAAAGNDTVLQANERVGRKTMRDGGATAKALARHIEATDAAQRDCDRAAAPAVTRWLAAARQAFPEMADFVVAHAKTNPNAVFAGSVPCLLLAGNRVVGWQLGRSLLVAQQTLATRNDTDVMRSKIAVARCDAEQVLKRVQGQRDSIVEGEAAIKDVVAKAF
jgi:hypothetical protein